MKTRWSCVQGEPSRGDTVQVRICRGLDGGDGIFRDALSAFWQAVFDKYFEHSSYNPSSPVRSRLQHDGENNVCWISPAAVLPHYVQLAIYHRVISYHISPGQMLI